MIRGLTWLMSGSEIGANTASAAVAGTWGNDTGSGSKLSSGTTSPIWNSIRASPLPAGRILPVGPCPLSCSRRFSRMIREAPKRSAIFLKSTIRSPRSATATRKLVAWIGRGSRLPSLAMTQNGIDWRRLSGLVRNT